MAYIIVLFAGPAVGPGVWRPSLFLLQAQLEDRGVEYIIVLFAGPVGGPGAWRTSLFLLQVQLEQLGCGVHHCYFLQIQLEDRGVACIIVLFAGPAGGPGLAYIIVLFEGQALEPGCGVHHCSCCRSSWRTGVWRTSLFFLQVQLEDRGVAYINTDICMVGQILEPAASPTLAHLYKEAVKVRMTRVRNSSRGLPRVWSEGRQIRTVILYK